MNTALFRTLINLKMSGRPKHSVSRLNYSELADIKIPRRSLSTKVNETTLPKSSTLYQLKILERDEENKRVKVRYIGYSRKYDEWRKADDIVDLNENDSSLDEGASLLLGRHQLRI